MGTLIGWPAFSRGVSFSTAEEASAVVSAALASLGMHLGEKAGRTWQPCLICKAYNANSVTSHSLGSQSLSSTILISLSWFPLQQVP